MTDKPMSVIEGGGAGGIPEPDWAAIFDDELDVEFAREQWRIQTGELRSNEKLATANTHQIKRLIISYVMYDLAARRVIEQGAVLKAKKNPAGMYNLWWTVLTNAETMATKLEAELTLSPRRRNNGGKVKRQGKATGGASAYLRTVPK